MYEALTGGNQDLSVDLVRRHADDDVNAGHVNEQLRPGSGVGGVPERDVTAAQQQVQAFLGQLSADVDPRSVEIVRSRRDDGLNVLSRHFVNCKLEFHWSL